MSCSVFGPLLIVHVLLSTVSGLALCLCNSLFVVELEMRNETNGAEWMSFACKWNTEIKSELDRQNYGLKPHSVSSGELEPKWLRRSAVCLMYCMTDCRKLSSCNWVINICICCCSCVCSIIIVQQWSSRENGSKCSSQSFGMCYVLGWCARIPGKCHANPVPCLRIWSTLCRHGHVGPVPPNRLPKYPPLPMSIQSCRLWWCGANVKHGTATMNGTICFMHVQLWLENCPRSR